MLKRYLPIVVALLVVVSMGYWVVTQKANRRLKKPQARETASVVTRIEPMKPCGRLPAFLQTLHITQPVMIDLSQQHFKGVALLSGKGLRKVLHPKQWEQFAYLGTYVLDPKGNIYLTPMPFISIEPTTFNLQTNIYRLDTQTGKLSLWMHLDDVKPSSNNPYGVMAIAYDCADGTLWVSAIDESGYQSQKGVIYHIDPRTKRVLNRIEGFDALSLAMAKGEKGERVLLAGSAMENTLYAFTLHDQKVLKRDKIYTLPDPQERIRKIRIKAKNFLEIETVLFSYTLIARSEKLNRKIYKLEWNPKKQSWESLLQ